MLEKFSRTAAHTCTAEITAASAICKQKKSLVPPSRFQNKLNRENGYRKSRIESWPIGSNQNKSTASERNSWREVNKSLSSKYFSSTRKWQELFHHNKTKRGRQKLQRSHAKYVKQMILPVSASAATDATYGTIGTVWECPEKSSTNSKIRKRYGCARIVGYSEHQELNSSVAVRRTKKMKLKATSQCQQRSTKHLSSV